MLKPEATALRIKNGRKWSPCAPCFVISVPLVSLYSTPPLLLPSVCLSQYREKPARFCPNGYNIPSSRLKTWQRLLGWCVFWAVDRAKPITQTRYITSSSGRKNRCEGAAQIHAHTGNSNTHWDTFPSPDFLCSNFIMSCLQSEVPDFLDGGLGVYKGRPPAGSLVDIIPMCGSSQWPVWWCWYRSRADTQLLFTMWLAQVDGPRPQAKPTPESTDL